MQISQQQQQKLQKMNRIRDTSEHFLSIFSFGKIKQNIWQNQPNIFNPKKFLGQIYILLFV